MGKVAEEGKIADALTVYEGRSFSVKQREVKTASGRIVRRDTVMHPGAAVFLPITAKGNFLFVKQYRHSIGHEILECPAGSLNSGESPLACAQREICEEVGVAAADWEDLGTIYPAPGFCNEVQYLYLARQLTPAAAACDEDEIIEVVELNPLQLLSAIETKTICDGKSLALLLRMFAKNPQWQTLAK
jgi:ADP-ribose pyrophosphatase